MTRPSASHALAHPFDSSEDVDADHVENILKYGINMLPNMKIVVPRDRIHDSYLQWPPVH